MPATRSTLADQLRAEFAGVPRAVLDAEITVAERELAGQVPAGSLAELLHRLVAWRLRQRAQGGV
jgi:hypothetical protein